MERLSPWIELAARLLLVAMFLIAGFDKISGYEGTQQFMQSKGVPGALLPVVIALEIAGGLAVAIGYRTRIAALLLAGFTLVATLLFHGNVGDSTQMLFFLKNLGVAGGLLLLVVHGAGPLSADSKRAS
ncbi:MAG: DoxX family protein [Gammaproteobacteria bacterium]